MDKKVLIQELVDSLSLHKKISKKDAEIFIRTAFDIVEEFLLSEQLVKVKGIGTFKLVTVDSRESINVNTGERITIDSHSKISFTPDPSLRDRVNKPFADFETVILNDETKTEDMERIDVEKTEDVPVEQPVEELVAEAKTTESPVENEEIQPVLSVEEPIAEEEVKTEETPAPEVEAPVPVVDTPAPEVEVPAPGVETPAPEADIQTPVVETMVQKDDTPAAVAETEPNVQMSETPPVPEQPSGEKKSYSWLYVLLLLVVVGICWIYFNRGESVEVKTPDVTPPTKTEQVEVPDSIVEPEVVDSTPEISVEERAAQHPQVKYGKYWMVGTRTTHVLQRGEDLTQLAVKYYGDKLMISYIIKYNGIKNPSKVLVGTRVEIPELVER